MAGGCDDEDATTAFTIADARRAAAVRDAARR